MRKFLILILVLPFFAASCTDIFNFGGGTKGVFKSEDGAQTFEAVNKLVKKGDIANVSVNALAFDPTNPEVLYAGVPTGVYKSENGGKSWRYMLAGMSVASVAVDSFAPKTVYAAGLVGTNGKIIKSTDAGTTWVDVYSEPSKSNSVLSVAVSRSSSSTILAGLNNGELIRSTDSGGTWQVVKDLGNRIVEVEFGDSNSVYALTISKGLYKSSDTGVTWASMTDSLTTQNFNQFNQPVSSATAFYDLALDLRQSGVIYLGTEQGLFRTVNDGTNWSFLGLPLKNAGLRVSAVSIDPSSSNTVFASVASTIYKSINGGLTWETKVLPTSTVIHSILINPISSNIIYLGLRNQ